MTDPIADMLTRIRNAIAAKHTRVDIPGSKLKLEVARILKEEGYINNFVTRGEGVKYSIRIFLRFSFLTILLIFAIFYFFNYCLNGIPIAFRSERACSSVFAVVTIEIFIPRVLSTLLKSISGKIFVTRFSL